MSDRPLNVLVCESDNLMATLQRIAFEQMGHVVQLARTELEALQFARTQPIDLLVASLGGPSASGLRRVLEVRKILPDVAVLICSGLPQPEHLSETIRAPVAFLEKPFSLERLALVVKGLGAELGRRRES